MCEYSACPNSWLHNVQDDLAFLRYWQPQACTPDCWQRILDDPLEAMVWAADNAPLVRRTVERALGVQTRSLTTWATFQLQRRHRGESPPVQCSDGPDAPLLLACDTCGATFSSRNALAGHQAKQHASVKLARRLCGGCTCPICLINFGEHERLIRHLSFSGTRCLAMLAASRPQGDPKPGVCLDKSARPSVQAHGPLLPVPSDLEAELFPVVAECSCFDVQALQASVASVDSDLAVALSSFDDSLNLCMSLPEEPTINPDGNALIQKWTQCS